MRLPVVAVGRRTLAAVVLGGLGLVAFALVTGAFGIGWGLNLLAAAIVGASFVIAKTHAGQRHQDRTAAARHRAWGERWQEARAADDAQLEQLRTGLRRLHEVTAARFDALDRAQRRAVTTAVQVRAQQRRDRADAPSPVGRDSEIALIGGSDLFDPEWYRAQVGMRVPDPVAHYVDVGASLGVDPHRLFPATAYLERYPDALERWRTPLAHYLDAERDPATVFAAPLVRWESSGRPDLADLRWEYLVRGLHRVPDTFVLYRIVGNDLPPRHRSGQGLDNLRFVLANEPDLPGCQKRWLVNRIVDPRIEKQVIALLEEHGTEYLHIPFDPEEYRRVGWRFAEFDRPGFTYRREFDELTPAQQRRALDHVYHDKNLYVMNNNGARNAALRDGRGRAKWVLPWDGNCFVTRSAWDELVGAVTERPYLKYFTVPMARILDNEILLRPAPQVEATEEPQLLFRSDAREEFHPDARYGRRPKVELFYRLGITGPWDTWGRVEWDVADPPPSTEAGQVGQAGWVARLFSGEQHLEEDSVGRLWRRIEAIWTCIDRMDEELARKHFQASALFTLDEAVLERQRAAWAEGAPGPGRVVAELVAHADRAARRRVGDPAAVTDQVAVLALAGHVTGEARYAAAGVDILRTWFLGRAGRRRGRRRGARIGPPPVRRPDEPSRYSDDQRWASDVTLGNVHVLLDAARLLERQDALAGPEAARLRAWVDAYRGWLRDSAAGRAARAALDHRGTWYDVQLAAVDAYLDDVPGFLATLRRAYERVGQQFAPDGSQPEELTGTRSRHGCAYNLQGWAQLATYARRVGQDLWAYQTPDGRGLAAATRRLLDRGAQPWPAAQAEEFDQERLVVLAHQVAAAVGPDVVDGEVRDPWRVTQIFPADTGIRPFWVLGSAGGPS